MLNIAVILGDNWEIAVIQLHRNRLFILFFILFCHLIFPGENFSQARKDEVKIEGDTTSIMVRKHSPRQAALYSAILPGLGQAYNRKFWKMPIVYAGFGTLAYFVVFNNNWLGKYTSGYLDFTDTIPGTDSYLDLISSNLDPATFDPILHPDTYNAGLAESFKNSLKNNKDYYRRNRDLSYIGMVAWYLLNIIDATVDAHFYDFDIGEDLSLRFEPMVSPIPHPYQPVGIKCLITF